MKPKIGAKFIFSTLTAIISGVLFAFLCIEGVEVATADIAPSVNLSLVKISERLSQISIFDSAENEEDPTFISHFSRGFNYRSSTESPVVVDIFEGIADGIIGKRTDNSSSISALAYSVANIESGMTLLEKNPDKLLPIASVTKLVTAVVAKKLMSDDAQIEVDKTSLKTEGNTGFLRLGEKLKVKELMYPLLMVSSNDAAEVLARAYGRDRFIAEMNRWVRSIGATRTSFRDPSGLSAQNISTASDMSTIGSWIMKNEPEIFDITLAKAKSIRTHTWVNPTHFLSLSNYEGGKNGYTPEANRTNISFFSAGSPKQFYSVVILGSMQRDIDTLAALNKALN